MAMDQATSGLILQIQLEDIEDARSRTKGKGREGDGPSDAELALHIQKDEIERTITELKDRRMAVSMIRAVLDDGATIAVLAGEERMAAGDRDMACRLSGHAPGTNRQALIADADEEILSRFSAFDINDADSDDEGAVSTLGNAVADSNSAIFVVWNGSAADANYSTWTGCCNEPHRLSIGLNRRGVEPFTQEIDREELKKLQESSLTVTTARSMGLGNESEGLAVAKNAVNSWTSFLWSVVNAC
ncbi:MAG: hypothetical protein Q9219_005877 [cf. Caloplaca sp. 3 TL-2023]